MAKLLTLADVLKCTGLPQTSVWRYRQNGTFPASVKVGTRNVLFKADEISAWLLENRGQKINFD